MPSTACTTSVEKTGIDDRSRWDRCGAERKAELAEHPERFPGLTESPIADEDILAVLAALAPLGGSRVLELGCGLGKFSVYLALHGASVTAVDVGPHTGFEAADLLARVNGVECNFRVMDISALDFPTASFDRIVGLAVFHHLRAESLPAILDRVRVLLRPGGVAVFSEPIEDTRWFDFLQNLIPAGDPKSSSYRPSWLQRKAWREYVASLDDPFHDHGGTCEAWKAVRTLSAAAFWFSGAIESGSPDLA